MSAPAVAPRHTARRAPARIALLLIPLAVAAVGVWVVVSTTPADRTPLAVFVVLAVALLFAAAIALIRQASTVLALRQRVTRVNHELVTLADETLPAAIADLRRGYTAETVQTRLPSIDETHQRILRVITAEIGHGERRRAAAMAACANAAGRVQALTTRTLADLRDMENKHAEHVLGDLLRIDHATAQTGRLADSIAVLSGARSGRRWTKPITMESVLRGAMGRISGYRRIRVHSASTSAVVGYAAEDVMHSLAELMDNATRYSAPSEEVHVYVEELHAGIVVTIEDAGLGMNATALQRAEQAVSPERSTDITTLSGTRLGLAVVGQLARKHRLQVFFRPSSRGGAGVVVRIPQRLIVQPDRVENWGSDPVVDTAAPGEHSDDTPTPPGGVAAIAAPAPPSAPRPAAPDDPRELLDPTAAPGELPRRRRGQTLAGRPSAPDIDPPRARAPLDGGERFGTFRRALRGDQETGGGSPAPPPPQS